MTDTRPVPIDSETLLIAPGLVAPPLVCVQYDDGSGPCLVTRAAGAGEHVRRLLNGERLLVGHNIAFDLAVWAAAGLTREVFSKLDRGQVHCTWVYERLGEITGASTRKSLDLATCCKAHGIRAPETKGQGLELQFGQFERALEIPEPWRAYALGDLIVGKLYARQRARFHDVPLHALARLTYRQFCLQLLTAWGMQTDERAVAALQAEAALALANLRPEAARYGFVRSDGSRCMANIKAGVEAAYGSRTPRTPCGAARTDAMTLEAASDPRLQAFTEYAQWIKTLNNDVPNLRASGTGWISTRYGLADTLRTTSGGDRKGARTGLIAMQNLRQRGGVRECIVPRPGMAFYDVDASGLELCALAQLCVTRLGLRGMAAAIAAAGTPGVIHTRVGAQIAGQSEAVFAARVKAKEPAAVEIRTRAKNGVFGYMGGLGPRTYVDYIAKATKGKTRLTLEQAQQIRADLYAAVPDIQAWLAHVGAGATAFDDRGRGSSFDAWLAYDVVRRGVWYAAAANNPFQSIAAGAMTEALIDAVKACYVGSLSPARPCLFVHDELLFELPEADVHDFEQEFLRIAAPATRRIMPDVPVVWDGEACNKFSKRAQRIVRDGRLAVWKE